MKLARSQGMAALGVCAAVLGLALAARAEQAAPESSLAPRPAEAMPRAEHGILLDLVYTGKRYVAAGERGDILVSADGRQWRQVAAPVRAMLNRLRFADQASGWALGYDGSILHTADGGDTWQLQHYDAKTGLPLFDALFVDGRRGFAVGARGLFLRTDDGGANWQELSNDIAALGLNLYALCRLHDGTLLLTGEKGLLARSADGGQSWQMLKSPYAGSLFGALPYGDAGAVVYGLRGNIYLTGKLAALPEQDPKTWDEFAAQSVTDAAALQALGWQRFDGSAGRSLFGASYLDAKRIVFVGAGGVALIGDLAQGSLQLLDSGTDAPLSAALGTADGLLAVGRNGVQQLPLRPAAGVP